jgi:NADH:ubiquinone oxidoreductase subunit 4 (subunit M)
MPFPILTSLIALPIVGALLLLLLRDDEEHAGAIGGRAGRVGARVRRDAAALGALQPASADFQFVERHAWIPAFGSATSSASTASACCWSS